jgi:hypothetical protein
MANDLLIKPKFRKTPKNRKKDQYRDSGTADQTVKDAIAFSVLASPVPYAIAKETNFSKKVTDKVLDYKRKKKKESKKSSPEIKAEGAKKGKMIKLNYGGAAVRGTKFKGVF